MPHARAQSWLSSVVASLLVLVPLTGRAQERVIVRERSSVLLQRPASVQQLPPVRRPVDASSVLERPPIATAAAPQQPPAAAPRRPSAFALAAPLARMDVDSQAGDEKAAARLADRLYGSKAQLTTLHVLSPNTASVWVGDSATKEKAPPGLDVAEGVVLPFRYMRVDEATGATMALKPWFDDGGGLRYDSKRRAYVATLRIGLRDTLSRARARLTPSIVMSVGAAADSIAPERLEFSETNVFTTQSRLVTSRVNGPMRVIVWPDFASDSVELWVPLVPDYVQVRVDKPVITGFGLSSTNVTVSLSPGAIAAEDSLAVTLSSTAGEFEGSSVVYPKGATPVTVKLRSDGIGQNTITATADPFVAGTRDIRFAFPFGLAIGALVGALIGSALSVMRERKRVVRKSLGVFFASGVLTGLVIALIVAVGVFKIPGFELATGGTALVSLLAGVLGGYVGPKGLEGLAAPFRSGRPAPPAAT